ncbi:IKI3-domain-containing protein [Tilletiaria anomala UBC 951]|uniref:IKI3-domain-containing protein n=1 Tax=Tilletiaria anomala (strain ATCC 24038 / CBS 436.72 / UBC 951) TaxID=1037660 RepID=A0A066VFP8_TILAU|nr:IKI3-domain-containing protein [Tilletiaria anomala UBC 951]KDN37370.1 IKI3-domain-containing protein [Tilletiaria anomala UBC 951]
MRNLSIIGRETLAAGNSPGQSSASALPATHADCEIQAITVSSTTDEVYVAGVDRSYNGKRTDSVKIHVWHQLPADCYASSSMSGSSSRTPAPSFAPCSVVLCANPCPFNRDERSEKTSLLPTRSSYLYPLGDEDGAGTVQGTEIEIISLQYLNDGGTMSDHGPALCLITAGGDILLGPLPSREEAALERASAGDAQAEPSRSSFATFAPKLRLEVVGSIEQGIYAAQWSPDEDFLVVVTAPTLEPTEANGQGVRDGEGNSWEGEKVLIMTKEFEVLSEKALATDEFGEDKPVDVGWGSKATQFHGSEGKEAAAAAAEAESASLSGTGVTKRPTRGPHTLDDDGRPRISWKGDASFFAISSLDLSPPAADQRNGNGWERDLTAWNRVLRVFTRSGALSSTSDAGVRGISQALAYKPLGNLIATTQRFGRCKLKTAQDREVQWSHGREGRHDVVFFERNGLRHGEFTLREEGSAQPKGLTFPVGDAQEQVQAEVRGVQTWKRQHFVRDLTWNVDGSALAVVLEREDAKEGTGSLPDAPQGTRRTVVQIWTMGNYHYYLKQEVALSSDPPLSGMPSAVVRWHPEDAMQLYLAEKQSVTHLTLTHETCTTISLATGGDMHQGNKRGPMLDAACVAVADGTATLLTPFRLQNIPPPMCTTTLVASAAGPVSRTPIHYAWASVSPSQSSATATAGATETGGRSLQHSTDVLAMLYEDTSVELVLFDWGILGRRAPVGGRPVPKPLRLGAIRFNAANAEEERSRPIQVALLAQYSSEQKNDVEVSVASVSLLKDSNQALVRIYTWRRGVRSGTASVATSEHTICSGTAVSRTRLITAPSSSHSAASFIFVHERRDDRRLVIQQVPAFKGAQAMALQNSLPTFCSDMIALPLSSSPTILGLAPNGRLYANQTLLAQGVNSYTVAGSFLVWTNNSHEARFLPLSALVPSTNTSTDLDIGEVHTLHRSVERGSRIVTAVPSEMALVLQMPRGNLETINPRPLVLEVVRRDLNKKRYRSALRVCRTHRLDLNILHDHCPQEFMANLQPFIRQVADVDHFNLFLTSLKDEDVTSTLYKAYSSTSKPDSDSQVSVEGKTNRICEALRIELECVDSSKYLQSILTSYARQTPPDYEGALSLLLELKDKDAEAAAEAVKYIVFLADAEKLYDVALGMYDFTLALMLAQHATRKDPREYLPFLRELRGVEPVQLQRFQIDDHLGRHQKAFRWLSQAGEAHHQHSFEYMQKHELFEEGFVAFGKDPPRMRKAYELYGDWMMGRSKPADAAVAFVLASEPRKATDAYQNAGLWQDALATAVSHRFTALEVAELARTIIADLETSNQFADAAQVSLGHLRDVESAVMFFCKANDIAQAKRICALYGRLDLVETTIKPQTLEAHTTLLETITEMQEQLTKQFARLCELLSKAEESSDGLLLEEDNRGLDNIEVMSDTSTQITHFTRYTQALTSTTTASSSHRSRNTQWKAAKDKRKKEQKKKESGRKGSVYEENYLYESLQRLLKDRLKETQEDVERLALSIVALSPAHRNAAIELQQALLRFEATAEKGVEMVHAQGLERERLVFVRLEQQGNEAARAAAGAGRSNGSAGGVDPNMALMKSFMELAALALEGKVRGRPRLVISEAKWRSSLLGALDPRAK